MDFATTLQSPWFQAIILILVLGILIYVAVYSYMSWNEYDTLIKNADSTTDETTLTRWKRNKAMEMAGFILVIVLAAVVLAMIIFLFSRSSAYRTMMNYYDQGIASARAQYDRLMTSRGTSRDDVANCVNLLNSRNYGNQTVAELAGALRSNQILAQSNPDITTTTTTTGPAPLFVPRPP